MNEPNKTSFAGMTLLIDEGVPAGQIHVHCGGVVHKIITLPDAADHQGIGFNELDEFPAFEHWWENHGQYHRAGGGQYEKTFACGAWMTRARQCFNVDTQPMQPVVIAGDGVARFKQNPIVRHLLDFASPLGCGLNDLGRMDFNDEDRMQLAQLIGYSVSGYGDLSYASKESVGRADALAEALGAESSPEADE